MSFFPRNFLPFLIGAFLCAFAWVFGGTRGDLLPMFVPWGTALVLAGMLFLPQRRTGEPASGACLRVWRALVRDPLTWVSVGFLLLLAIPLVNVGLCPACEAAAIAAGADPKPPLPFLPFCLNRAEHYHVFLWFLPALTAMLAVKHALVRSGKRFVLETVVWNGLLLSAVAWWQIATDAGGPLWTKSASDAYFYSTWGYPNMAADYFATLFFLSVALWRRRVDDAWRADAAGERRPAFWRRHLMAVPAGVFFLSTLQTLSRAGAMIVVAGAAILAVHAVVCHFRRLGRVARVRAYAWTGLAIVLFGFLLTVCVPEDLKREMGGLGTTTVLDRVSGKTEHHRRVALEIWREHPVYGTGGWGYKHYSIPKMRELGYKPSAWMVGGVNTHNDVLQFLAEHGVVGLGLLAVIVVLLLAPTCRIWNRLASIARFAPVTRQPPHPRAVFALPAGAFAVLLAATATLVHSTGDCPLRSAAVLTLFFAELAAVDGFLPSISDDPTERHRARGHHRHHSHHHHHHHI